MNRQYTRIVQLTLICGACFLLNACSISIDGKNYSDKQPAFEIENFFDGKVLAWGIVQDRSGEIIQRFEVNIEGSIASDVLTLNESFKYSVGDGPKKRIWQISKNNDGSYSGSAGDIAGTAKGQSFGNAFNFTYEMDLEVGDSTYRVNFKDWFWAFDSHHLMNRSYIKKFGIVMAEVTIFMQKQAVPIV